MALLNSTAGEPRAVARPALFAALGGAHRVTLVSAPPGSGKTMLVRSWIAESGLADRVAWVSVGRRERDPLRFWLAVLDALRGTSTGADAVGAVTASPDVDAATVVDRLLDDLSELEDTAWLVIDDLQDLDGRALDQLQQLLTEAPERLRLVLLTRRDVRLGLHRLRLDGELSELRAGDLRFTAEEARGLFASAGLQLSDGAVAQLVERTEGWAAGLRLAALSLAGHPEPDRFAADFSGSDRTVAEYLLEEVLHRQPPEVSRLLLRTSILDRVCAPLADQLTGGTGSDSVFAELEEASGFVVAVDAERRWFRYHRLFADLLALELRRTASDEVPGLHVAAAEWLAAHGQPIEAIRHAQAAPDWKLATRLLADHWFAFYLDGDEATGHELIGAFPSDLVVADAELAAVAAAAELTRGSLHEAERYLALAAAAAPSVASERRGRLEVTLTTLRLTLARQRTDLAAVGTEAEHLLRPAGGPDLRHTGIGGDLRALALSSLGIAAIWTGRLDEAELHLDHALAAAREVGRPLLELAALAHSALLNAVLRFASGEQHAQQAVELARVNGWEQSPFAAVAYVVIGTTRLWECRLQDADGWLERAHEALRHDVEPAVGAALQTARGVLAMSRGRYDDALRAFRASKRLEQLLVAEHPLASRTQAHELIVLIRMGESERAARCLDGLDPAARDTVEMRVALATLCDAQGDPEGVTAALQPLLAGGAADSDPIWGIQALLLEAIARQALRDAGGASRALERALDVAESPGLLLPFILFPVRDLLEAQRRMGTSHASLVADILTLMSGRAPSGRGGAVEPLAEPLSASELRVLRYLPTNLPAPEIAGELFVSVNTVRTHMRHVYAKLGVHRRADAVQRARELGLLSTTGAAGP